MHKFLLNRARIALKLKPRGGFLIKDGDEGRTMIRPDLPDLQALRTRIDGEETVFIPGSSLKGVFRSAFERQLRSFDREHHRLLACDPLNQRGNPCHENAPRDEREDSPATHARLCLACRSFGSQQIGGRIRFADALPLSAEDRKWANATEQRFGVSIDRKSGGPSKGKLFEMEVVTKGVFDTAIQVENFQLWQLGLLATLLADLKAGELRLGSATTRGLGAFRVVVPEVVLWQVRGSSPMGVKSLGAPPEYEWLPDGALPDEVIAGASHSRRRGGQEWRFEGDAVALLLDAVESAGWSHLEAAQQDGWTALATRRRRLN